MQYLPNDVLHYVIAISSNIVLHDALVKDTAFIFGSDLEVCLEKRLHDDPQLIMRISCDYQYLFAILDLKWILLHGFPSLLSRSLLVLHNLNADIFTFFLSSKVDAAVGVLAGVVSLLLRWKVRWPLHCPYLVLRELLELEPVLDKLLYRYRILACFMIASGSSWLGDDDLLDVLQPKPVIDRPLD